MFAIVPQPTGPDYGEALLSLVAAKQHLQIELEADDEDELVAQLRDAAIDFVEQYTNVRLGRITGVARFTGFGPSTIVGVGPAATFEVTAVRYRTGWSADLIELAEGAWFVDAAARLVVDWPKMTREGAVDFVAGYPTGTCPPALIAAAKLVLGHLYRNRETVVTGVSVGELPLGARALCDRYRMPVL